MSPASSAGGSPPQKAEAYKDFFKDLKLKHWPPPATPKSAPPAVRSEREPIVSFKTPSHPAVQMEPIEFSPFQSAAPLAKESAPVLEAIREADEIPVPQSSNSADEFMQLALKRSEKPKPLSKKERQAQASAVAGLENAFSKTLSKMEKVTDYPSTENHAFRLRNFLKAPAAPYLSGSSTTGSSGGFGGRSSTPLTLPRPSTTPNKRPRGRPRKELSNISAQKTTPTQRKVPKKIKKKKTKKAVKKAKKKKQSSKKRLRKMTSRKTPQKKQKVVSVPAFL